MPAGHLVRHGAPNRRFAGAATARIGRFAGDGENG
jgi:hypothetical protein